MEHLGPAGLQAGLDHIRESPPDDGVVELFVNSRAGRGLRLRGLNARILASGIVWPGDRVSKLPG